MSGLFVGGLTQGAYFVLIGLGVVLIYRQSGVLNFSLAPVATLGTYVVHSLLGRGLNYWIAAVIGIAVATVVSALIELIVVRPLSRYDSMTVAIATFGPGLMIIGLLGYFYGNTVLPIPGPLTNRQLAIGRFQIGSNEALAVGLAIACVAGMFFLLNRTRFGLSLRAASEGPVTARMMGINVSRVQTIVWALAGGVATMAGLLLSAHNYLDPTFLTTFKIGSFAAIVLGGMESLAGLAMGSVLFGLASSGFAYFVTVELLQTLNFVAILVVLTLFPYGLFGRRLERVAEPTLRENTARLRRRFTLPRLPSLPAGYTRAIRYGGLAAILVAVALYPYLGSDLAVFIVAGVGATLVGTVGLNFISGYVGQGSLGQAGFIAIGAYVYSILTVKLDVPPIAAIACAVIVSAAAGLAFGWPAMRLNGVYLALLTLAFTLAVPEFAAFPQSATGGQVGMSVSSKGMLLAGVKPLTSQYWIIALFAVAAAVLSWRLGSGRIGRRWRAVRDSELGAASTGLNVARTKLIAFSLSGALGGLSGVLSVFLIGYIAPDTYSVWLSAFLLAAIIIGGRASTLGSLLGAPFIVAIPFLTSTAAIWSQVFFGFSVLAVLLLFPNGISHLAVLLRPGRTVANPPGGGSTAVAPVSPAASTANRSVAR